ncbi:MAG TPA: DNA polymerase III subunit delta [Gammaproteobacteria bacterium]
MKLPFRQLDRSLRERLSSAYLVTGDEPLLVDEALEKIRAAARKAGFEERELHVVDRSFPWAELEASADNLSLFAARKIVELRLSSPRPGEEGGAAIRSLVERPSPDRLLILALNGRLDAAAAKAAWVKSIERHGTWVEVWPVDRTELPDWIAQRARGHGLTLTPGAAALLAERVEGNLLAADQELKKLALAGERTVDEEAVAEAVANSARFDVYRLSDAVAAGDAARAIRVLDGLRAEGTEPVLVCWALNRELSLLARLKFATEHGVALETALAREHVWPRRQPLVKSALRRYRWSDLKALLVQAAETDAAVKGGSDVSPWEALTALVLASLRPGGSNPAAERRA